MRKSHPLLDEVSQAHEPMVVVCSADDNYSMPLAATLYSALAHLRAESRLLLYLIDGGISDENKSRLNSVVEEAPATVHLKWVNPDLSSLSNLRTQRWLTAAVYLRLLIPEVLPAHLNKAIFLDSDLIVREDLTSLWSHDVGDHAILAVQDFGQPYVSSELGIARLGIDKHKELGIAPDTPYFNAGVMLLNLDRWRSDDISQKVFEYLREYRDHLNCLEQEGLNVVLAGAWGMLDPKWNQMSALYTLEQWPASPFKEVMRAISGELIQDPYIIHFTGRAKPWKFDMVHPAHSLFFDYLTKAVGASTSNKCV